MTCQVGYSCYHEDEALMMKCRGPPTPDPRPPSPGCRGPMFTLLLCWVTSVWPRHGDDFQNDLKKLFVWRGDMFWPVDDPCSDLLFFLLFLLLCSRGLFLSIMFRVHVSKNNIHFQSGGRKTRWQIWHGRIQTNKCRKEWTCSAKQMSTKEELRRILIA